MIHMFEGTNDTCSMHEATNDTFSMLEVLEGPNVTHVLCLREQKIHMFYA